MINYDPTRPLISIHIPKCGGTSFMHILKQWFKPHFHTHYPSGRKVSDIPLYPTEKNGVPLSNMCIHGHFNSRRGAGVKRQYPGVSQYISFLRDPLEMKISLFFYNRKRFQDDRMYKDGEKIQSIVSDLDDFLRNKESLTFYHFPTQLTPENYKEEINNNFIHIGITEEIQRSVNIIAEKLNKPKAIISHNNRSNREWQPSPDTIDFFKEKHAFDYEVYNFVKLLNS